MRASLTGSLYFALNFEPRRFNANWEYRWHILIISLADGAAHELLCAGISATHAPRAGIKANSCRGRRRERCRHFTMRRSIFLELKGVAPAAGALSMPSLSAKRSAAGRIFERRRQLLLLPTLIFSRRIRIAGFEEDTFSRRQNSSLSSTL